MSSKLNITKVFTDHFRTLYNSNNRTPDDKWTAGDIDPMDALVFLGVPFILSILLILVWDFNFGAIQNLSTAIVSGMAIFVGLLFNALVLLLRSYKEAAKGSALRDSIKELISNISFNITIAFISVILILIRYHTFDSIWILPSINSIIDAIALGLLICFALTFFMVMKRVSYILDAILKSE